MEFTYKEREYQSRLVASTVKYFTEIDSYINRENHSVMLLSPCGSGKTVTAMRIIEELYGHDYKKIVFIAHRHRLLKQANDYFTWMNLDKKCKDLDFRAVSIYEKDVAPLRNADLVVFDEAHHSACDSGVRLVGRINPRKTLGLTATNWRSDRIKLVFEKIVEDYGINSLIELGYLSQYNHYLINKWSPDEVVSVYLKDVDKFGKSIMFFHTSEESEYAVSLLKAAGIKAASVYGTMSEESRELIYTRFEMGEIKVICNLMLLTEGIDFPDLQSVFVKPSVKGLTIQMGGRVLRLATGKTIANIVQVAGDGYSFARVAKSLNSYVQKGDKWTQTSFSKEFITQLTEETLKYRLSLAKNATAMESMKFNINQKEQEQFAFINEHRRLYNQVPDLEELAAITEGAENG
jgi:superfamily II DNA or RNA helicase